MTVNEYYSKLNDEISNIILSSKNNTKAQSSTSNLISNLQIWYQILKEEDTSQMLINSIQELDVSCLQMMQGLYRGAFSSLRLSVEMLMGAIHFSAHNLEYREWEKGSKDLNWSIISCQENGILSTRFSKAYFPGLESYSKEVLNRVKKLYRSLSEMVHGNNWTWTDNGINLKFDQIKKTEYHNHIKEYEFCANYMLCLRFLYNLESHKIQLIESYIIDSLQHIEEIRIKLGGSI